MGRQHLKGELDPPPQLSKSPMMSPCVLTVFIVWLVKMSWGFSKIWTSLRTTGVNKSASAEQQAPLKRKGKKQSLLMSNNLEHFELSMLVREKI